MACQIGAYLRSGGVFPVEPFLSQLLKTTPIGFIHPHLLIFSCCRNQYTDGQRKRMKRRNCSTTLLIYMRLHSVYLDSPER